MMKTRRRPRYLLRTSAAVIATATIGGLGTDVRSSWYRALRKPPWQPPGVVFGPVWTTLYALTALASARTLDRIEDPAERRRYAAALAGNLTLNVGWTWIFFRGHRPTAALFEIGLLELSTLDLVRRSARHDPAAAGLLLPYAGWVAFAAVLTGAIARANPATRT